MAAMCAATLRTGCNRDCPDACGLIATVEDGRLARCGETRITGDEGLPVLPDVAVPGDAERPAAPFAAPPEEERPSREASWGKRLAFVAERLLAIRAESGPAAILHYRSGGSLGLVKSVVDYFFSSSDP